jgi:hypothetical protein
VTIEVEGDRDRRVAESLRHHFRMYPVAQQLGCMTVPQVVEPDTWNILSSTHEAGGRPLAVQIECPLSEVKRTSAR